MSYKNIKLEEFEKYIYNKKVAIIGIGVSNKPLLDYFYKLGAKVTVFDNKKLEQIDLEIREKLIKYSFEFSFGDNCLEKLKGFNIIFRSPSCRPDKPEILEELKRGAILTSEIEMLMELCPGIIIGITGSDGKTTTTSLIYEIIKQNGYECYLGGNIGIPLFTKVHEMTQNSIVVLELSSFQLMNMKISPNISIITNVSPNHLDIHKSYDEYINAKKNIFLHQNEDDVVVLNYDNEITKNFAKEANGKIVFFSRKERLDDGVICDNGILKICEDKLRRHVLITKDLKLRGNNNIENVCAAISATKDLVPIDNIVKTIKDFKGVEHRLEFVREINGVKWYNDSIGTSPTRTIAGLNSFDENIVLIAGGYDKHLDYSPIAKPIIDNVRVLILMGATANKIREAVESELKKENDNQKNNIDSREQNYIHNKKLIIYDCKTLNECIQIAKMIAIKGEVVLFSPASASFDMFKNFEERGNKFKEIVLNLDKTN